MVIVLIGSDGQLGTDLLGCLRDIHDVHAWTYPQHDITRPRELASALRSIRPELVINTAAFNRVDECEEDPVAAFSLNVFAVRDLTLECREIGAALMHFSTDYVFDGTRSDPYTEDDTPNPLSVYGVSKLSGEYFVRSILTRYYLIRTSGLYGLAGCWGKGSNFVDTMLRLGRSGDLIRVVDDQWVTPTSSWELAQRLVDLIESGRFGLYHLTNSGQCTWYAFAKEIFRQTEIAASLSRIDTASFGAKAVRPAYSVLHNRQAERIGLPEFLPWQEALREYLRRKGNLPE
jgi:dTDP-4-dehydrorhamnose reductase